MQDRTKARRHTTGIPYESCFQLCYLSSREVVNRHSRCHFGGFSCLYRDRLFFLASQACNNNHSIKTSNPILTIKKTHRATWTREGLRMRRRWGVSLWLGPGKPQHVSVVSLCIVLFLFSKSGRDTERERERKRVREKTRTNTKTTMAGQQPDKKPNTLNTSRLFPLCM